MLDEAEFEAVASLYYRAVRNIKSRVRFLDPRSQEQFIQEQYKPVLDEYRRICGRDWSADPSHLLHHRISKYGPPCRLCGKPLRTPKAVHGAACGADRSPG
jgi:hypothetical protein